MELFRVILPVNDLNKAQEFYEKLLEIDSDEEQSIIIQRWIMGQRCIIASGSKKPSVLLNHPIHRDLKDTFISHIDRVCNDDNCLCDGAIQFLK